MDRELETLERMQVAPGIARVNSKGGKANPCRINQTGTVAVQAPRLGCVLRHEPLLRPLSTKRSQNTFFPIRKNTAINGRYR